MAISQAKVHNLRPTYPPPDYNLGEKGQQKYDEFCSEFAEKGMLSALVREEIMKLAVAVDQIAKSYELGKSPTKAAVECQSSAIRALRRLQGESGDGGDAIPAGDNVYAGFGFAKRAWAARHGRKETE